MNRNDDLGMGDKALKMTPEQRKELRINKSTLCHIQKNLGDGKKVKPYNQIRAKMA